MAKDACDSGRVLIGRRSAKAGSEVSVGDEVTILFGSGQMKIRVLDLHDTIKKEDADKMYEVIE